MVCWFWAARSAAGLGGLRDMLACWTGRGVSAVRSNRGVGFAVFESDVRRSRSRDE